MAPRFASARAGAPGCGLSIQAAATCAAMTRGRISAWGRPNKLRRSRCAGRMEQPKPFPIVGWIRRSCYVRERESPERKGMTKKTLFLWFGIVPVVTLGATLLIPSNRYLVLGLVRNEPFQD